MKFSKTDTENSFDGDHRSRSLKEFMDRNCPHLAGTVKGCLWIKEMDVKETPCEVTYIHKNFLFFEKSMEELSITMKAMAKDRIVNHQWKEWTNRPYCVMQQQKTRAMYDTNVVVTKKGCDCHDCSLEEKYGVDK